MPQRLKPRSPGGLFGTAESRALQSAEAEALFLSCRVTARLKGVVLQSAGPEAHIHLKPLGHPFNSALAQGQASLCPFKAQGLKPLFFLPGYGPTEVGPCYEAQGLKPGIVGRDLWKEGICWERICWEGVCGRRGSVGKGSVGRGSAEGGDLLEKDLLGRDLWKEGSVGKGSAEGEDLLGRDLRKGGDLLGRERTRDWP